MATKLANPKQKAETQTKSTLVNFTVKQKDLEEQLISVVIQIMEAKLEKSKNNLINKKSQNEITLHKLDNDILKMLQKIKGRFIDDENLIVTLDKSKETEEEVKKQIETSAVSMKKTRENYHLLARIASKLFFVLKDFHLLIICINQPCPIILNNLETSIYDSLQEKLSDIALDILKRYSKLHVEDCLRKINFCWLFNWLQISQTNLEEYNFFLRGENPTADRKNQPLNPISDWFTEQQWLAICDLDKLPNFTGFINAFTHNGKEWKKRYFSPTSESDSLPGEWDQKCDSLKKMILLKIIIPNIVVLIQ